ncbi:MAG: 3-phosphoglycerate dehydrogenase [Clostridia bacterium]|nr:3-phosphoglycerate dehydrogenase [Clostridia bacterium]
MFNVQTLNKISAAGLSRLGDNYTVADDVQNPDAVLVRSASLHEIEFPESLLAIARAGAGVNNIPLDKCAEKGIVVFNTPGANANAVKELVITALLISSRNVVGGIEWAKTLKGNGDAVGKLVEKGKSQFVGPEIKGKTLGVVGLGAIGILVANAAVALGMDVIGYDPFLSVDNALRLSHKVKHVVSLDEVFAGSDYITVHVPLTPETKGVINAENIAKMKDGVRIINYSRADLVVSADIAAAIESGKVAAYTTDFATDDILDVKGVIVTPHLGASTPESEDNCAQMAADEIKDYLENGNIKNSVTLPAVSAPRTGAARVTVIHKNVPNIITTVTAALSETGNNIESLDSKSKKDYAYTIIDTANDVDAAAADKIAAIDGVIRVRVIK